MREYAAVHGLFVEFRGLPGSATGRGASRAATGQDTIYYGKRLPPAKNKAVRRLAWIRDGQGWRALEGTTPLPAPLALLPDPVMAVSVDDSSCGIYWREAGQEAHVELIRRTLEEWSEQLRS